jgi:hypothetical protein
VKRSAALIALLAIAACAAYPTSRTFYEPHASDGTPTNRTSCGYVNTRDSIRRTIDGVEISISPAHENIGQPHPASLPTSIGFTYRRAEVQVDLSKIRVRTEPDGATFEGEILEQRVRPTRRMEGEFLWNRGQLLFPKPAGLSEGITYVFLPGALQVGGREIVVSPFRFTRVTKQDVYYGSINC